ncbi:MAG: BsuPI-related putative proteinase inhibitor [Candidatus Natronoplasma sp.]
MDIQIELKTDKDEYEIGENIEATLSLVNQGDVEEKIFFNNGQRYDFVIKKGTEDIWRWSKGKVFIMATGTVSLAPGKERSYTTKLDPDDLSPGEYELIGIITGEPKFRESCSITFIG